MFDHISLDQRKLYLLNDDPRAQWHDSELLSPFVLTNRSKYYVFAPQESPLLSFSVFTSP